MNQGKKRLEYSMKMSAGVTISRLLERRYNMDFYEIKKQVLSMKNRYCTEDIIDYIIDLYHAHVINLKERNILINMI